MGSMTPLVLLFMVTFSRVSAELTFAKQTDAVTVPEDLAAGSTIYTVTVTGGTAASFAITEGGIFEVETNGVIKLKADASLDHEANPSYILTITGTESTDGTDGTEDTTTDGTENTTTDGNKHIGGAKNTGGLTATMTLTVTVTNVAPSFSGTPPLMGEIPNEAEAGGKVNPVEDTSFEANDPGGSAVQYAIASGNTNEDFTIDTSTGTITVNADKTIDIATTPCYTLVITANDGASPPLTGTTTVIITVVDGAKSNICLQSGASFVAASLMAVFTWAMAYMLK